MDWVSGPVSWTEDLEDIFASVPDVLVEVMGGVEPAFTVVTQAMERGAGGILCERPPPGSDGAAVIVVDDTRQALLDMTSERLRRRSLPIVAVTGSAGKTTTAD